MALRDLSMDVQDLKGAMYLTWDITPESVYIAKPMEFKDQYSKDCRNVKGTGKNLGHQKNYIFMGIYLAMRQDKDLSVQEKEKLETLVGLKIRTEGTLDIGKAGSLAEMVAYCQVVRTKKKGFLNLLLRGEQGAQVMEILGKVLDNEGHRQWDAGPPKPIHREVKLSLEAARQRGNQK